MRQAAEIRARRSSLMGTLVAMALVFGVAAPGLGQERGAPQAPRSEHESVRGSLALGISRPPGDDIRVLDDVTAAIGRRPALWSIWIQWGQRGGRSDCYPERQGRCGFPLEMAYRLAARGVTPVIWWEPVDPSKPDDPTYPSHRNVLTGQHDDYIRAWARDARDFGRVSGSSVVVRFAHEHNGSFFPWGVEHFGNTPATFRRAWRHVWRIFREEGALPYVRFLWSVTKQRCPGCNPFEPFYPGDRFVDYVGFSAFNWGADKTWKSMTTILRGPIRHLEGITDKPIIVAELASSARGGDRAAWIRRGYQQAQRRWPRIEAILYLDTSSPEAQFDHPDWALVQDADASSLEAYAVVAGDPRFQGSLD